MTAREFEVFQLPAERLSNKSLGDRLHISGRTADALAPVARRAAEPPPARRSSPTTSPSLR